MSNPVVVAWRTPEDFKRVYECLYSDNIIEKRWAIDRISVWQVRSVPSLPTSIETTADLVRATIQDMLFAAGKTFCKQKDVQLLYSMAIVRFVSLMLELKQNSLEKIPLGRLAKKANIPSWMVDVRNDASHGMLWPISVLQMATKELLQWLDDNYWKIELSSNNAFIKQEPEGNNDMLTDIQKFREIQYAIIEGTGSKSTIKMDHRHIMDKIKSYIEVSGKQFVEVLCQPGVFVNVEDAKKLLVDRHPWFLEKGENIRLPETLEKMWYKVLYRLFKHGLIPHFLEQLLLQKQDIRICQKMVAAWGLHILDITTASSEANLGDTLLGECFKGKPVIFNNYRLFYSCMRGINSYTHAVLYRLLLQMDNAHMFQDLAELAHIYLGDTIINPRLYHEAVYTAENVEEDIAFESMKKKPYTSKKIWSYAPMSIDFSKVPLGAVLNPLGPNADENAEHSAEDSEDEEVFIINEYKGEEAFDRDISDAMDYNSTNLDHIEMIWSK